MSQKIEIISNAMILIGASPVSSLTEGTEGIVANALYETTYRGLLASHSWRFATKKVSLSRMTETPINEYTYMFQLPTDLINVYYAYDISDYEIYGDKLYTDNPTVSIDYVYRVDETLLPAHYELTLQFLLAAQFAKPVTDNSTTAQTYAGLYEGQLKRAKFTDSSSRPQQAIIHSPLTGIN